jgi:hypothetical protein
MDTSWSKSGRLIINSSSWISCFISWYFYFSACFLFKCLALNIFSCLTFFFIPSMQMPLYNNCLICVTDEKREWKWRYYEWFMLLQMSQNTDHEGNNEKQIIGISDNVEKLFVQTQNRMKHVLVIWKFFLFYMAERISQRRLHTKYEQKWRFTQQKLSWGCELYKGSATIRISVFLKDHHQVAWYNFAFNLI